MVEIKDKNVTVESMKALHDYNVATYMLNENPVGSGSLSLNRKENTTVGSYSVAIGENTVASAANSHAEGYGTTASGGSSHAEGSSTTASGQFSHAEGSSTTASGKYSHAEGYGTTASGTSSHVEGDNTTASGSYSHAEGHSANALGDYSHAEGRGTIASGEIQHVQGKYNIEDTEGNYAHIVGNGNFGKSSNAHTLDWNGNAWYAGNLSVDGNIILSSNQYGDTLPAAGTVGRIFFKKLSE